MNAARSAAYFAAFCLTFALAMTLDAALIG